MPNPIHTTSSLRAAIEKLEAQQQNSKAAMIAQVSVALENIQPINLLKNTLKTVTAPPDFTANVLNTTAGLGLGLVSKVIFSNLSINPLKKVIGAGLLLSAIKLASENLPKIRKMGTLVLQVWHIILPKNPK